MQQVVRYYQLSFLMRFPVTFGVRYPSDAFTKKVSEGFSVISNLAVTTRIAVEYSTEDFFLKGITESKQVTKSESGSKNNIKLTEWCVFLNRASQTCSQIKIGQTHTNCSLRIVKLTLILTKKLSKTFLMHESMKFLG